MTMAWWEKEDTIIIMLYFIGRPPIDVGWVNIDKNENKKQKKSNTRRNVRLRDARCPNELLIFD